MLKEKNAMQGHLLNDDWKIYIESTERLIDPDIFSQNAGALSEERQKKINSASSANAKRLSLAAGLALNEGLKGYGLTEREMKTSYGENGKPYFEKRPDIKFSLSHSGALAMAVFSDHEIGCDIQQMKEIPEDRMKKMAFRFFCPKEAEWMSEPEDQFEQRIRFYRLWVLKESFLKLTGLGLKLPMNSFCFTVQPSGVAVSSKTGGKYRIQEYAFGGYRAAAICDLS